MSPEELLEAGVLIYLQGLGLVRKPPTAAGPILFSLGQLVPRPAPPKCNSASVVLDSRPTAAM